MKIFSSIVMSSLLVLFLFVPMVFASDEPLPIGEVKCEECGAVCVQTKNGDWICRHKPSCSVYKEVRREMKRR